MSILRRQKKNSLKHSGVKHLKKICLSYISINTVTNKLEALPDFVAISETKHHNSSPTVQFNISGFRTLYRKSGGFVYL